jgi:hypothetical protein
MFRHLTVRSPLALILCAAATVSCAGPPAPAPRHAGAQDDSSVAPLPAEGKIACAQPEMFGPVLVPGGTYRARTGVSASRFSDLATTKALPLEECGLKSVLRRLVSLRCDDGSNPFAGDLRAAHTSRAGNFGPGGRCESIIDRYDVKCPEATYQVFADMYFCTPGVQSGS